MKTNFKHINLNIEKRHIPEIKHIRNFQHVGGPNHYNLRYKKKRISNKNNRKFEFEHNFTQNRNLLGIGIWTKTLPNTFYSSRNVLISLIISSGWAPIPFSRRLSLPSNHTITVKISPTVSENQNYPNKDHRS